MLLMNTNFNEDDTISNNRNFIKIEDEFGTVFRKESMNVDPNRSTFVKTKLEYRPNTGQTIKYKSSGNVSKVYGNNNLIHCETLSNSVVSLINNDENFYSLHVPTPCIDPIAKNSYGLGNYDIIGDPCTFMWNKKKATVSDLRRMDETSFSKIYDEVYDYENTYQMYFYEFIGLINIFFSNWLWNYPMSTYVIIDCKRGTYNVPKFSILNVINKDTSHKIYLNFIKGVSEISKMLKRICEMYGKNYVLNIFIVNECVIKIFDIEHNISMDTFLLTNSDISNNLMKSSVSGGLRYCNSEELNTVSSLSPANSLNIVNDIMALTYFDMLEWTKEYSNNNIIA